MKQRNAVAKLLLVALLMGFTVSLFACTEKNAKPDYGTEYQAIFTTSGHVMFGRIEQVTPTYVLVKDVYIPQTQVDPNTKETTNFFVNRSDQWHKPAATWLNPASIAMIESVAADSKAAKMIKEAKEKPPAAK